MNVTIYDVAREAGVSMATVSRVLNGTAVVKEETKQKVKQAIERLGYRPNAVARGLASKRTKTIGVIVPDVSALYISEIVRGIEDIAVMYRYHIILVNSDAQLEREIDLIGTMWEKQVDGIVFMSKQVLPDHIETFIQAQIPVVLCATEDPERRIPSVNIDYTKAIFDGARYLIDHNANRLLYVGDPAAASISSQARVKGFKEAGKDSGISIDILELSDLTYETSYKEMDYFLDSHPVPNGIIAVSDEVGLAMMHALQDRGFKVPEDVQIIGYDNTRLALMSRPQLTTISQPLYDIGAVSMRLLTKFLQDEPVETYSVVLPHDMVIRHSTF
ncbi:substrate-binding domain-containing protein [Fodinisporobacter ferrooxydans]|uniref:Substrate-binding domain-containing protein n=1 Tax=Fodinisporobacter ferrooxydans TaxID=2901836 RepID=A0ABY4CHI9_9BACL|nr:substrate-binding domain-containing protein [Alicyclobacillaceae bacterium MYW30-H2]